MYRKLQYSVSEEITNISPRAVSVESSPRLTLNDSYPVTSTGSVTEECGSVADSFPVAELVEATFLPAIIFPAMIIPMISAASPYL